MWFIRIISILLPDNWTEYTSTSKNLEQVPVTIKYRSNRKSTNPDLPQMQNGKNNFFTTAIKKIGSAPILEGRSANSKQTYFYFWPKILASSFQVFFFTLEDKNASVQYVLESLLTSVWRLEIIESGRLSWLWFQDFYKFDPDTCHCLILIQGLYIFQMVQILSFF